MYVIHVPRWTSFDQNQIPQSSIFISRVYEIDIPLGLTLVLVRYPWDIILVTGGTTRPISRVDTPPTCIIKYTICQFICRTGLVQIKSSSLFWRQVTIWCWCICLYIQKLKDGSKNIWCLAPKGHFYCSHYKTNTQIIRGLQYPITNGSPVQKWQYLRTPGPLYGTTYNYQNCQEHLHASE
jgi:hypothetical protein